MLTGKTNTNRIHPNPSVKLRASLLELQLALTIAESVTPAQPPRVDVNEQRAVQLIQGMRAGYRKPALFLNLQDIPTPDVRALTAVELSHA